MKSSTLDAFNSAREALVEERTELLDRVAEIDRALGLNSSPAAGRRGRPAAVEGGTPTSRRGNPGTLKEMVLTVTKNSPKTPEDILAAVQAAGYQFATSNPLNSLRTLLYTAKEITRKDGKFGPK